MRGAGNTDGGWGKFICGAALLSLGAYLLLDSVRVVSGGGGWISGAMGRAYGHSQFMETTSMGIIFLPLFIGVVAMAYDVSMKWARWLAGCGLVLIVVEMFSRIRWMMNIKTSHLVMMIGCCAIGLGLILASYRNHNQGQD
jgi:hypothetical protein